MIRSGNGVGIVSGIHTDLSYVFRVYLRGLKFLQEGVSVVQCLESPDIYKKFKLYWYVFEVVNDLLDNPFVSGHPLL